MHCSFGAIIKSGYPFLFQKNTREMIKLLYRLIILYKSEEHIFLSWDSASWHASKALYKVVDEINATNSEAAVAEISEPYAGIMAALSIAVLTAATWYTFMGATSFRILYWVGVPIHALECGSAIPLFYRGYIAKGKPRAASGFYRTMSNVRPVTLCKRPDSNG